MNLIDFDIIQPKVRHQRVKTPTQLQMDSMECGAICLSIVLAYYGKHVLSESIREACGVTRDGSKAINIIKAARNYGMIAEGKRIYEIEELKYQQTPFIIFWKFDHFIVVEGIMDKVVYINDPAIGHRKISMQEFNDGFTGVVLTFSPGEQFQKSGKKEKSVGQLLYDFMHDDIMEYIYLIILTLLLALPTAAFAMFVKVFIDDIIINNQKHWMMIMVLSMGFTTVFIALLSWLQQYYILRYQIKFFINRVPNFFWKLLHLPLNFFIQRSSGDISNRLNIYEKIAETLTVGLTNSITNLFSIFIFLFLILLINLTIGVITLIITLLSFTVTILLQRKITDIGRRISQDQAKIHGIEYSGIHIIEELKYRGAENQFFKRWASYQAKLIQAQENFAMYSSFISLLPSVLFFINLIFLIILGNHFIMAGTLTAGGMIAIFTLLLTFAAPIRTIVETILGINNLKGDLLRINEILIFGKTKETITTAVSKQSNYLLELNNVVFGYSKLESPILTDINLRLEKGKNIAITGVSGGGKSSLINLICGLYEPWDGEIYFEGQLIQHIDPKQLFRDIAYVDQNIFLFEGSIRDNVTLWDNSLSDLDVIEALKIACAYELVQLKGGLDFHVLEGGRNLSLGQAQRIEIARAIVKKPKLLLLDEATAALDSLTEAKIYKNLLAINCSFLIIAHRLSAISHCDEIVIIENGEILERGNHEALMHLNGRYQQFIEKGNLL